MNDQLTVRESQAAIAATEPMNGNKSLVRGGGAQGPLTMNELKFFGSMIHEAGLIPKIGNETPRQLEARAMAKVIAGHAYGFDPILSMRLFDVINGKLQPTSECTSVLIKRSGRYNYKVVEWTETRCDLLFVGKADDGKWKELGHSVFTIDDAKKAGYMDGPNKHNWSKIPRNMLLARSITNGKRLFCADVMDPAGYFGAAGNDVTEAVAAPDELEFNEPAQLAAGAPETVETATGEIVDTATGEVIEETQPATEEDAEAAAIQAEATGTVNDDEPINPDESNLASLRDAAADAYNSTQGEARARANKWLGKETIGSLKAVGLQRFLEAFPNM